MSVTAHRRYEAWQLVFSSLAAALLGVALIAGEIQLGSLTIPQFLLGGITFLVLGAALLSVAMMRIRHVKVRPAAAS